MHRTVKETLIIGSIKQSRELNLAITIAGTTLSRDEVDTLIDLISPKIPTSRVVHSVDISNIQELLEVLRNSEPPNKL